MSSNSMDLLDVGDVVESWNVEWEHWFGNTGMYETTQPPPQMENVDQERDTGELNTGENNHNTNGRNNNPTNKHTVGISDSPDVAIRDYNEVLNQIPQDDRASTLLNQNRELEELIGIDASSQPSGQDLNEIIARQAFDSVQALRGFNLHPHRQQSLQTNSGFDSANVDPRLRVPSDPNPGVRRPQRRRVARSITDTSSIASSQQIQSEAVFSVSSQTLDVTPNTSPQLSRHWTNSTQNTLSSQPQLTPSFSNDTTCLHCGRKFGTPSARRKHERSHMKKGSRPYVCGDCPPEAGRVDFYDNRDLRRHVFKEHPERLTGKPLEAWKSVVCESCRQNCSRADGLLRHLEKNAQTCGAHYKQNSAAAAGGSSTPSLTMAPNLEMPVQVDSAAMNVSGPKEKGRPPPLCPAMGDINSQNLSYPFSRPGMSRKSHQDLDDWY